MGIETALIVGAVAAVAGTATSIVSGNQQRAASRHANDLQEQAYNENRAGQAQQNAQAARDQYRQDRIKRAQILQNSANTGASYSSGEAGATGSLQTQYSNNTGQLASNYQRSQTVGNLESEANETIFNANQQAGAMGNISSIFGATSSLANTYASATAKASKIPGTTNQPA